MLSSQNSTKYYSLSEGQ